MAVTVPWLLPRVDWFAVCTHPLTWRLPEEPWTDLGSGMCLAKLREKNYSSTVKA